MKILKFLLICMAVFIAKSQQQFNPANSEALMEIAKLSVIDCFEDDENLKKIDITDSGFQDIAKGSRDAVRNAKCIRYCIMKKHQLFSPDDSLNVSEVIPFFTYLFDNSIDTKHMREIVENCNNDIQLELDRCERAHLAAMCILEKLQESGLKGI